MSGLVSKAIAGLFNGVSQQAPRQRFSSQAEIQENFYSSAVEGLKKRSGTEYVSTLQFSEGKDVFTHAVDRDGSERYVMSITDTGELTIYDVVSKQQQVVNYSGPTAAQYFKTRFPSQNLSATTVADFTFITNRSRTVVAKPRSVRKLAEPVFVRVLQGVPEQTYTLILDGSVVSYKTGNSLNTESYQANHIAKVLDERIEGLGTYFSRQIGSSLLIRRKDGVDIIFGVTDTFNDTALYAGKGSVQSFEDLPAHFVEDKVMRVEGQNSISGYYVQYNSGDTSGLLSDTIYEAAYEPAQSALLHSAGRGSSLYYYEVAGSFGLPFFLDDGLQLELEALVRGVAEPVTDVTITTSGVFRRSKTLRKVETCKTGYVTAFVHESDVQGRAFDSARDCAIAAGFSTAVPVICDRDEVATRNTNIVRGVQVVCVRQEVPVVVQNGTRFRITGLSTVNAGKTLGDNGEIPTGSQTGIWTEVGDPYALNAFDPETMPHAIVRQADGTFLVKPLEWKSRVAGDDKSVPIASFVDKKIRDITFYRNRLCFISDDSVALSRAADFFNFWPKSAKDVLDTDPIDVAINHTKPSSVRWGVPLGDNLVLFSATSQFVLRSEGALTPKQGQLKPLTEYECDITVKPVSSGRSIYYANFTDENRSTVHRLSFEAGLSAPVAANLCEHIPSYLPRIKKMVFDGKSGTMLCSAADSNLYIYRSYSAGQEEQMRSWSVLRVGEVESVASIGTSAYIATTVRQGENETLELNRLELSHEDNSWPGRIHLDRQVKVVSQVQNGYTVFKSPWFAGLDKQAYAVMANGTVLKLTRGQGPTSFVFSTIGEVFHVKGEFSGSAVIGFEFKAFYRLSPLFFRDQNGNTLIGAKLKVKTMSFVVFESGPFDVVVTAQGRTPQVHHFSTQSTLTAGSGLNAQKLVTDEFRLFPVGDGETTLIDIVSTSPKPLTVSSAVYEGVFDLRSRRV